MKILIAVMNNRSTLPIYFVHSLYTLVNATKENYPNFEVRFYDWADLSLMRNKACADAIAENFDFVFQMDTDMYYPPDTITKLVARGKEVIAGQCSTRKPPFRPVHYKHYQKDLGNPDNLEWCKNPDAEGLVLVGATGSGGILISTNVLRKLTYPYFKIKYVDKDTFYGEDIGFCEQCHTANIPIFVDTTLQYGHETRILVFPPDRLQNY